MELGGLIRLGKIYLTFINEIILRVRYPIIRVVVGFN